MEYFDLFMEFYALMAQKKTLMFVLPLKKRIRKYIKKHKKNYQKINKMFVLIFFPILNVISQTFHTVAPESLVLLRCIIF